jgi:hypothetical protein
MTSTDILSGVVDRARAKVAATEAKGASYVPQILDAHKRVVEAERSGHQRSLDAAIAAGELLNAARDAIKGSFKWSEWREEFLKGLPQTTASLYMRLAKNQDRLRKPDLTSEDGKRISNAVANLAAKGELSVRKAAALLAEKKPRGAQKSASAKRTDETVGRGWLKVLAADELVAVLRQDRGIDYLKELMGALGKVLDPQPASTGLRRV